MSVDPALVAGTQCPSRLKALPLKGGAFAAGGDAMVARRRHALMPMGPGDQRRDDSCAYGAIEEPPPTLCDPFSVTSRSGNGHGAAFPTARAAGSTSASAPARKRVATGQRVSVRVDVGGGG